MKDRKKNLILIWMNFADEIEPWIIDELKRVGCDTARSVLTFSAEELERRTDLEKETISDVINVLQAEFDRGLIVFIQLNIGNIN